MMDLRAAAAALGGQVSGRDQISCPGPYHTTKDLSLSVRFDPRAPDGFVVHPFSAKHDPLECKDYVRERLGLPAWRAGQRRRSTISPQPAEKSQAAHVDHRKIARAVRLWDEAQDPRGTPAEAYLKSRALELPNSLLGNVLRFHPRCP
jgi:putative DNA primase/helicase